MGSGSQIATGVTAFTGLLVFLVACVLLVLQNGQRRAALVAGLAPAALVPAVIAVALAALQMAQSFAGMAAAGSGGATAVLALTREIWWTARLGFGMAALISVVGLAGGLARFGSPPAGAPACSLRRAAVLMLLPCLALLVVAVQARELRSGVGIVRAVVADTAGDPARSAAVERYLEAHDLSGHGAAAIAAISERVTRATIVAAAGGGGLALVILVGLALTGTILAWRVRVGPAFLVASSALWLLLVLTGTLLALGLGAPPTF